MTTTARWLGLVLALGVAGCWGLEEPDTVPVGMLRVFAQAGNAGQFVARPEATFLNTLRPEFPDSRDTSDICQLADLVSISVGSVDNLDAGDSIAFISDAAGTVYLYPKVDLAGNESYVPDADFVSVTPGASVTFQIPGAGGFPAATFTALTAPALTQLSPIPSSTSVSDSVVVTWAPAGEDSSRFEISLQFATEGTTSVNRQVLCQWRDDGRGAIAGTLLTEWATTSIRHIEVSRYRTARRDLDKGAVLYFLATYDMAPEPVP